MRGVAIFVKDKNSVLIVCLFEEKYLFLGIKNLIFKYLVYANF